jgi:hypothetical protein
MDSQSGVHSRGLGDRPEGGCPESVVGKRGLGRPEQQQSAIWFGFARPAGLATDNWLWCLFFVELISAGIPRSLGLIFNCR